MSILSFDYDNSYNPSAPIIEVEIHSYSDTSTSQTFQAIVDSGADATLIPLYILETVGATYTETRWMQGVTGRRVEVDLYLVAVHINSIIIPGVSVVAISDINNAVIGRDVLNQMVVTLNGLAGVTEISLPE